MLIVRHAKQSTKTGTPLTNDQRNVAAAGHLVQLQLLSIIRGHRLRSRHSHSLRRLFCLILLHAEHRLSLVIAVSGINTVASAFTFGLGLQISPLSRQTRSLTSCDKPWPMLKNGRNDSTHLESYRDVWPRHAIVSNAHEQSSRPRHHTLMVVALRLDQVTGPKQYLGCTLELTATAMLAIGYLGL
jgi:hypothetical protein